MVEDTRPPMTTTASGRCTSLPVPVASNKGNRPRRVGHEEGQVLTFAMAKIKT
jgi:hypothetical protein